MAGENTFVTSARTDARDRLVEADEPLAGLQLRNGGELPGAIIAPALLELVRKARVHGSRLVQDVRARDGQQRVSAWVEVLPDSDGQGCVLALSHWQSDPVPTETPAQVRERRAALIRQFSEMSALLGPEQELISVDTETDELSALAARMRAGLGRSWTDFVDLESVDGEQISHRRQLGEARMCLDGSRRWWTAHLLPLGKPLAGSSGFELHFVADSPLPEELPEDASRAKAGPLDGLGRDIAPVLRQPVARIIANAETIHTQLAGPLPEEYGAYAADIASAGEHLLALIEDLATLEMVEDEDFRTDEEAIDLAVIARRAAGILGIRAQERKIEIRVPALGETMPATGEFRRVLQVVLNLIGNAIRYSPEGSQVAVSVSVEGGLARLTVADEGPGLDNAEQRRVFGKFERLGRSGDGGSGLGLYISRKLAEAMGGSLTVESTKGQGARFILSLPV